MNPDKEFIPGLDAKISSKGKESKMCGVSRGGNRAFHGENWKWECYIISYPCLSSLLNSAYFFPQRVSV